ncbi:MAG: hypothetical protein AUK44_04055 [Porphyromonadaceae bacterium CG2_30_38_12]|nr:MAG: hypothetical protein AUK44_04055 [Porphyromonadaceae bacterium CG2_30_38_12]
MSKFGTYNVVLKDLSEDSRVYEYVLDDVYFKKIDSPEVQKGIVNAKVIVQRKSGSFELSFVLNGMVIVPCNRCLEDMEQSINYKEKLLVKFGDKFSEEDEIVIVPESEGAINIAWFLYEFIVLNIPMKHVHAVGECNKTMVTKLKKHISRSKDDTDDIELDDDDDEIESEETAHDPRWDGLQNILENN